MIRRVATASLMFLAFCASFSAVGESSSASQISDLLQIRSVDVGGKPVSWRAGEELRLTPFPATLSFGFAPASNSIQAPMRLRHMLEGYDNTWRESSGQMHLALRFLDEPGEQIGLNPFNVNGNSAGWNGSLDSATLTHRRETLTVPPGASRLQVVMSSAGPPATVGIYVVDNLVVSRISPTNGPTELLLRSPFGEQSSDAAASPIPPGWMRDGSRPSMARIVEIGQHPSIKAFAVLDEDPYGHAEWDSLKPLSPQVTPGDQLLIEWNELFTMGMAGYGTAQYEKLPPGNFRFRVAALTPLGVPTGAETSLAIRVPPPFWRMPWFWGAVVIVIIAISVTTGRYLAWHRMRRSMLRLQQERIVEQERLRIAQNIHDDLGARVTQISLVSGMARSDAGFPEKARADFDTISRMSRDLVSALYETVWTVNPENDNLDALGNYLCQTVNQMCNQAQLRCRLHMLDLPPEVQVSSQTRHNMTMAVKEAVHNVIKHAKASEVSLHVAFTGSRLTVSVRDDGCGFPLTDNPAGNGLANMKRRLASIAGNCTIESQMGRGTTVALQLTLGPAKGGRWNATFALDDRAEGVSGNQNSFVPYE